MLARSLTFLLIFSSISTLLAGTTGKIAGIIRDKSTGNPLPGVNIEIEELSLGAASDINGEYYIINIPVGKHRVKASFIGYKTLLYENIEVQIDRTVEVNFTLEEDILEIGGVITVLAERERVKKDLTMSSQHIAKEEIEVLPVDNFESVAQLVPGAVGNNFRGGRGTQVVPIIDGINVRDANAGYPAVSINRDEAFLQTNLILPETSIEQMEVVTGGFNAEYGNAQSAVINVITKEGGTKHAGRLVVRTSISNDMEKRYWYKNPEGEFVYYRDQYLQDYFDKTKDALTDSLKALGVKAPYLGDQNNSILSGNKMPYFEMDNYQRQEYEFSLSGPVPFSSANLSYSLHSQIVDKDQIQLSYWGPQFQAAFQGKIIHRISPRHKLQFIGMGSWINSRSVAYRDAKYPGGYIPGYGQIPPKIDTEEYDFNRNFVGSLKWTHTISNQTFYEIQAGFKYNTFDRKMKDWNDRDGDGDFDEFLTWKKIAVPEDESDPNSSWEQEFCYVSDDMQWFWVDAHPASDWEGGWKWGVPDKSEWREVWYIKNDVDNLGNYRYEYEKEWRFLTGTINEKELEPYAYGAMGESELYPSVPDGYFTYYGDGFYYYDNENQTFSLKADVTSQITKQHLIKGGINLALTKMDMLRIQRWGWSIDDYQVQPITIEAYFQDKMEFEGMIINAGLRLDYYYPGKDLTYPGDFQRPYVYGSEPRELLNPKTAEPFISVSPRLGISHPISEYSVLHFTYGHFYQRPEYRFWYQNMGHIPGYWRGNLSMRPERTISYEAGLKQNIGQFLIGMSIFYKDIFDMTNWTYAGERPLYDYILYINRDWADVRGFELSIRKFFSHYIAGNINYTFMVAKGSNSTPWDDYTQVGPERPYYLNWDQRHTFNANITFSLPERWGPTLGDIYLLGDWNLNILYTFNSPQPYTPPTRNPQPETNMARLEPRMQTDIKLSKRFTLINKLKILFLLEGYNIFNRKNILYLADPHWYEETGSPEGRNFYPGVWDSRRFFRFGIGFEF